MSLDLREAELLRERQRLDARPECFGLATGEHRVAGYLAQHARLRRRRGRIRDELVRMLEMFVRALAVPAVPPELAQPRLGLGSAFSVTRRQQCIARPLECAFARIFAGV